MVNGVPLGDFDFLYFIISIYSYVALFNFVIKSTPYFSRKKNECTHYSSMTHPESDFFEKTSNEQQINYFWIFSQISGTDY